MSYQLIHLHAETRATASTQGIPNALEQALKLLSISGGGTVYSYRTTKVDGTTCHILTRSCKAAGGGRLAHHLAMSAAEAAAMVRHEAGPTPAGIMLALEQQGFWLEALPAEGVLDREPKLSATELPDASLQPTWKALTGHKDNARSFYTPPYAEACLALLPEGTPAREALLLFHESDWLLPSLGWGRSFTTGGTEESRFEETQRIAAPTGSPLQARAQAEGVPVLGIDGGLCLPPEEERPAAAPAPPQPQTAAAVPPVAKREAPLFPYTYAEPPDEAAYNVPIPSRHKVRNIVALSLLALLAVGLYGTISGGRRGVDSATRQVLLEFTTDDNIATLRELLERPYSPQVASQKLAKLSRNLGLPEPGGEPNEQAIRLHECVEMLRGAHYRDGGYAAELQRLMEAAELLNLPAGRLATFYLCEATRGRDAATWRRSQLVLGERAAWTALAQRYPHTRLLAQEPMLAAYMQAVIPEVDEEPEPPQP